MPIQTDTKHQKKGGKKGNKGGSSDTHKGPHTSSSNDQHPSEEHSTLTHRNPSLSEIEKRTQTINDESLPLLSNSIQELAEQLSPTPIQPNQNKTSWSTYVSSYLVFVFMIALYGLTMYRSISGGDSGELIITTCKGSVAHPPGYPTFSMLGMLMQSLPLPGGDWNPALRMNMLSALLSALACVFMCLSATKMSITRHAAVGVVAAVLFGCSPTVWMYSIQGEVFALNNMLCCLMLWICVLYFDRDFQERRSADQVKATLTSAAVTQHPISSSSDVLLSPSVMRAAPSHSDTTSSKFPLSVVTALCGAFVCGLAMTNQHTTVFYVLSIALFVALRIYKSNLLTVKLSILFFVFVFLGLLPYLYLPIAAFSLPMDSWGDQRTLGGFLHHFFRKEYGTFQLASSEYTGPGVWSRLLKYADNTQIEGSYIALPLAALAVLFILSVRRHNGPVLWVTLTCLTAYSSYMAVFHYLANLDLSPLFLGVQMRFWMQANIIVFFFAALGFELVIVTIFTVLKRLTVESANAGFVTRLLSVDVNCTSSGEYNIGLSKGHKQSKHNAATPHTNTLTSSFLLVLYASAIIIAGGHCLRHFSRMDHHDSHILSEAGKVMVDSFPQNAIVMLNGDINSNIPKYYQSCEGRRPDLSLLSLQLTTWEWFGPMQQRHYPDVVFPGDYYHPRRPGCYSMKEFLDANIDRRPVFLCGGFKDGDDSQAPYYTDMVFGLCKQIFRKNKSPTGADLTKFLHKSLLAVPKPSEVGVYDPVKFTADTWDYAWYSDVVGRLRHVNSVISFMSNQNPAEQQLLKLSKVSMDYMYQPDIQTLLQQFGMIHVDEDRAGGIIYGQYAAMISKKYDFKRDKLPAKLRAEFDKCECKMLYLWTSHFKSNAQSELAMFVKQKINPYTRGPIQNDCFKDGLLVNPFE